MEIVNCKEITNSENSVEYKTNKEFDDWKYYAYEQDGDEGRAKLKDWFSKNTVKDVFCLVSNNNDMFLLTQVY